MKEKSERKHSRPTLSLRFPNPKIVHGSNPESSLRINRSVIAPQSFIFLLAVEEPLQQFILARLPVQYVHPTLPPNQNLLSRINAFDVGRYANWHIKLQSLQTLWPNAQVDGVQVFLDDVNKTQAVGSLLVVRTLAKSTVKVQIGFRDGPSLE